MKNSRLKATVFTMSAAIFNAGILSILNLVYSNFFITNYGSNVNGLISTLTQFVSFFTILEGGFSVAVVVAAYEPTVKKDYERLNNILYTASIYLRKISILFFCVAFLAGLVYVQFINSQLDKINICILLFLTVLTSTLSFSVVSKYSIVISADNKGYIKSIISIVSKLLTWIMSIAFILLKVPVVWIYSMNLANVLLNIVLLKIYEEKKYPEVNYKGRYDRSLIKGTGDVFFQKIASTFFSSTDLILISAGISLAMSSVYNLYSQIFHAIFNVLVSVIESPQNSFGQILNGEKNVNHKRYFGIYLKLVQIISTILLTSVGSVILSFIEIYTRKINDINYVIPSLAFLFFTQFYLQLNNRPYGLLLNVAGQFRLQNMQSGLAAVVNLVLSVILMQFMGVSGIILGSIVGTAIILVMNISQCYKHVLKIPMAKDVMGLIINYVVGMCCIAVSVAKFPTLDNYLYWFMAGVCSSFVIVCIVIGINSIVDREGTMQAIQYVIDNVYKKGRTLFKIRN